MYRHFIEGWISTIQSFKKELTRNWPEDMKVASDSFVDAQSQFVRSAVKSTLDFNAGVNKAIRDGLFVVDKTTGDKN